MPITEGLMKVGNWDLELVDDAPTEVRRAFRYGANIFVTPTHLVDPDISVSNLAGLSVFGGLTFRKGNQLRRFGGPGMLGYLQTGKGEAGGETTIAGAFPATFATILGQMLPGTGASNGLGAGSSFSPTATTATLVADTYWPPTKPVIDDVAAQTGNEYRCLPNGTVDYGVSTSLFRSTPTVVVSPDVRGRDATYMAVDVAQWEYDEDIDNFRNRAFIVSNDGTSYRVAQGATASDAVVFLRWGSAGNNTSITTPLTAADTNVSAQIDRIATAVANRYATPNYSIRCRVSDFCIPRLIICGDWVYVYSADDDLKDATNQIHVLGQIINPKKMRVTGYTYPIEAGMGVYAYYYSASGTGITDVTDFVKWEQPGASLEIETKRPSVTGGRSRSIID